MLRVSCPVTLIATRSLTPLLTKFLAELRRISWGQNSAHASRHAGGTPRLSEISDGARASAEYEWAFGQARYPCTLNHFEQFALERHAALALRELGLQRDRAADDDST